jgi:hypothetical protein
MPLTLEDLDRRLTALEREVAALRPSPSPPPEPGSVEEVVARIPMLQRARETHHLLVEAFERLTDEMGIRGEPVGAENLQAMIRAEGIIDPNLNEFSQGIIDMREE